MDEANQKAEPPAHQTQVLEEKDVEYGKGPPIQEMSEKAEQPRSIPVVSDDSAKQVRDVHAREAKALAGRKHAGESQGGNESGKNPTQPVHSTLTSTLPFDAVPARRRFRLDVQAAARLFAAAPAKVQRQSVPRG